MLELILYGVAIMLALIADISWIRMFQIKEYRFDRLKSQLLEGGWDYIIAHTAKPPAKSLRNGIILIFGLTIHGACAVYLSTLITAPLHAAITCILAYPVGFVAVTMGVMLSTPLAAMKRQKTIHTAKQALTNHPVSATVISGSYAKSTVKELLFALSSSHFKTAKTRNNMNTEVGVAQCVVDSLTPQTQQFIAEVGGYRMGEVRDASTVLQGHIDWAVITAFGNQHVSLYGSRDNLIRAESELLFCMNPDSTCYISLHAYQDPLFQSEILPKAHCRFITYSLDETSHADIIASKIITSASGVRATIFYGGKRLEVESALLGKHAIENMLPVVGWGIDHAIDAKALKHTLQTLEPLPHKLSVHRGVGESSVLDDSGNSSLHGFLAAIDVMSDFSQTHKVIVGPGIIELGDEKGSAYERLIQRLNDVSIPYITTDSSFNNFDTKGMVQVVKTEKEIMYFLHKLDLKNTLILLEGRQPKKRLESIIIEV